MSGGAPEDDSKDAQLDHLLGRTIAGKFAVESVISSGAMGVLYRARQVLLDKVVAIKVMHAALGSNDTFVARFHLEAKAASRLDHPNSIRILDFGEEPDGLLYIVMDYLAGRDLSDVIEDDWPLSVPRVMDILSQVLSALAVAHEMGVLHRDLKPENIMVLSGKGDDGTPKETVKVCDFGIAKMIEAPAGPGPKLSTGGLVLGTPCYMSPEQARGDPLDPRSDVYSTGVILYQMLTKKVPFDAPTPLSILFKVVHESAAPPSTLYPQVDAGLEAVCVKAMAKDPAARYESARQMRLALLSIVGSEAQPSTDAPRSALRWAWIGAAVVVAAAGAVVFAQKQRRPVTPTVLIAPQAVAQAGGQAPSENENAVATSSNRAPDMPPAAVAPVEATVAHAAKSPPTPRRVDSLADENGHKSAAAPSAAPAPSVVASDPHAARSATPPPAPPLAVASSQASGPVTTESRAPDPAAAHVEIGPASGTVGATSVSVNKALGGVGGKLDACYRSALAQATEGPATLHVETNDDGVIVEVRLDPRVGPSLRSCIVAAVRGRKIANVDTGRASADIPLVFKTR